MKRPMATVAKMSSVFDCHFKAIGGLLVAIVLYLSTSIFAMEAMSEKSVSC